jgi:peptidoglycan/xylan/chitin deacetylase (PgdA/CDA1 family)
MSGDFYKLSQRSEIRLKSYAGAAGLLVSALLLMALRPGPVPAAEPVVIWSGPTTVKQVAITFDDGPSPRYTPQILALLKHYQAHATFFALGRKVEKYPHLVRAQLRAGNEVCNHTYDHPHLVKISQLAREQEMERTAVDLDLLGDKTSRWIRPPYSAYDDRFKAYVAHTHGHLVLWSLDSGDWRGLPRDAIIHNVLSRVRPGAIIIFHDSDETDMRDRRPTVAALKVILPALKAAGYKMVTVSELVAEKSAVKPASTPAKARPPKPKVKSSLKASSL